MSGAKLKKSHYLIIAIVALAIGHFAYIFLSPYVFMGVAMKRLSNGWTMTNQFIQGPQTTMHSRQIVRPSPDMAYSVCVYDLRNSSIHIRAAPWDDYMSISVFAANGDNIYSVNDREAPNGVDFVLEGPTYATIAATDVETVYSPSMHGIILDRRLAPTKQRFELAKVARQNNICAPNTLK
ncbi:MAG: hypothetical protein FD163_942 [Hyphomonadaceae bacterium]|nr:MAG: hypothetical protein FD163_942 [Hyphomonadaceae bacterium]